MMLRTQQEWCVDWRRRSAALAARAEALRGLAPARLERPRADGGWSAAQVLEHLVLTSESYLAIMRQRVERGGFVAAVEGTRWRPRLGGRLLAQSLESPRRLPAPRGFRPGPRPRPHVLDAFVGEMHELDALLVRAESLPWNRIRFGSPVLALLRLNFGDGCRVLITHAERHFGQIDRVLAESDGES